MNLRIPDDPLLLTLRTDFSFTSDAAGQPRICSSIPARPPPRCYRPIQLGPAPARSFAAIVNSPSVPSQRVLSPVSPTVLSVPQPTECNAFPRARQGHRPAPGRRCGGRPPAPPAHTQWDLGDGTESDGVDDLNADPTLERQFQVQAKGVHKGGTVKRFDDRGQGRATLVGMGTRITNGNVGPSVRAPANGTIDLGKFRKPDVPKKRQRERERERKPFITLHPPPVAPGSALLLQVPARKREHG